MTLPRHIHQIWLQGEAFIPTSYQNNVASIKTLNPKFRYTLWDECAILNLPFLMQPTARATYYKFRYLHQKVDFARYCILFQFGGMYIDMDAECVQPLEPLFASCDGYDVVLSQVNVDRFDQLFIWGTVPPLNNGVILCQRHSTNLHRLIDTIMALPACSTLALATTCISETTGPALFSRVFRTGDNMCILPPEYLEPCAGLMCTVTANTYIVHRHALSWHHKDSQHFLTFYLKNKWPCRVLAGIVCLAILAFIITGSVVLIRRRRRAV